MLNDELLAPRSGKSGRRRPVHPHAWITTGELRWRQSPKEQMRWLITRGFRWVRSPEEDPYGIAGLDEADVIYTQFYGLSDVARALQQWGHGGQFDTLVDKVVWHDALIGTLEDKVDLLQPIVQRLARHYDYADPVPQIESPRFDRDRLLDDIEAHVSRLKVSFDEPVQRLEETIALKGALRELWRHARQTSDRYLSDVAGMLYDAWRRIEAEALTPEQVRELSSTIASLRRAAPMTLEDAISTDNQLRAAGLESLPI